MLFRFFYVIAWGRRILRHLMGLRRQVYVADRVGEYRELWAAAAFALGATFTPLSTDVWDIQLGGQRTRISNDLVQLDDPVTMDLAGDKTFCAEIADRLAIPTPLARTFDHAELTRGISGSLIGGPLVVKPAKGTGSGIGVTVGVRTRIGLMAAAGVAAMYSRQVIVQRLVAAETVRLLFLDGEMIHAVRRRGVRIVGDGASTTGMLIDRLTTPPGLIPVDAFVRETLRQQERSLRDVPAMGEAVLVRWLPAGVSLTDQLRTIYDEEITDRVGAGLIAELTPLVTEIGARFAAVDVLTNDPSKALRDSGGVFLEVNTTPGLHHHCFGDVQPCPTAIRVLRRLLSASPPDAGIVVADGPRAA